MAKQVYRPRRRNEEGEGAKKPPDSDALDEADLEYPVISSAAGLAQTLIQLENYDHSYAGDVVGQLLPSASPREVRAIQELGPTHYFFGESRIYHFYQLNLPPGTTRIIGSNTTE